MKRLPARALVVRALLAAPAVLALALGVASLPWYAEPAATPPRVVASAAGTGPLQAGAASASFALPAGVSIGGFARRSYSSDGVRDPVGARALVLATPGCTIALASADVLLIPKAIEGAVRAQVADLGIDGLVVAATHTHAGPGGYWEHSAGERIATGPYDPRIRAAIAAVIAAAIRRAHEALAPAAVSMARGAAADLARSRSGGDVDGRLTVLRVDRVGGGPIAEVAVFAAHPTILGGGNRRISADWPGRFVSDGRRGTRLLLQGAIGDQSAAGPDSVSPERFGDALSARVEALSTPAPVAAADLAFAGVEVALPSPEPGAAPWLLRRAARNLARSAFPPIATVEAVRIGDLVLVGVPAEPVATVAAGWRAALPAGAEILSLADGYVGYVEEASRMAAREGETARTYFGPELADRLGAGVKLAAEAVSRTAPVVPARTR